MAIPKNPTPKFSSENSCLTHLKVLSPQVHGYSSVPRGKPYEAEKGASA
jgi:hypothetical protein